MSDKLKSFLDDLSFEQNLPSYDYLFTVSDGAASTLETEVTDYRPANVFNSVGGLIDFTSPSHKKLPLIIVPDMHARAYFLRNILNFKLPENFLSDGESGEQASNDETAGKAEIPEGTETLENAGNTENSGKHVTVFEALTKGLVRIVFVGDLLHSELRCRLRWMEALVEFKNHIYNGKAMTEEMQEGLTLLSMIMELKIAFPEFVHILKGNHENIMNLRSPGDYPFRKFANEGEMVRQFMSQVYGDDILMIISCFEKNLPLAAIFPDCIISHAEPVRAFSRDELINGMDIDDVIRGLTWTENNAAKEGSVKEMLDAMTLNRQSLYFGGHRPIQGSYALRQKGRYVQIHNPDMQYITLVYKNKPFDLDRDIVRVGE